MKGKIMFNFRTKYVIRKKHGSWVFMIAFPWLSGWGRSFDAHNLLLQITDFLVLTYHCMEMNGSENNIAWTKFHSNTKSLCPQLRRKYWAPTQYSSQRRSMNLSFVFHSLFVGQLLVLQINNVCFIKGQRFVKAATCSDCVPADQCTHINNEEFFQSFVRM